jgi:hypothetical protein
VRTKAAVAALKRIDLDGKLYIETLHG